MKFATPELAAAAIVRVNGYVLDMDHTLLVTLARDSRWAWHETLVDSSGSDILEGLVVIHTRTHGAVRGP